MLQSKVKKDECDLEDADVDYGDERDLILFSSVRKIQKKFGSEYFNLPVEVQIKGFLFHKFDGNAVDVDEIRELGVFYVHSDGSACVCYPCYCMATEKDAPKEEIKDDSKFHKPTSISNLTNDSAVKHCESQQHITAMIYCIETSNCTYA